MNKAKKGQKPPPTKKSLQVEHVMRFLTLEMPQLATKTASFFPDYVPEEFKPESVQLLEKLHQQLRASSIPATGLSQAEPPETQSPARDTKELTSPNSKRPGEPSEQGGNSKRQKQASKTDQVSPAKKQEGAKAPAAKPRSLASFFGAAAPRPQEGDVGKAEVHMEDDPGKTQSEQDVSIARREVDVSKDVSIARREVDVSKDVSIARREVDVSKEVSTAEREVELGKDDNDFMLEDENDS
eukprot:TRINITY_DN4791_c0_g1_i2.p1 TRINITY_DN4791_c0_g1~~TRINITY_DN4791_c0_g1_i2.p1  ORF type:complete len:241 (+),score=74.40 TRINITY_DN4791_c0_g1_i2:305-1027(+)